MSPESLKSRVQRDTAIAEAEGRRQSLREQALAALQRGDFNLAEAAIKRSDASLDELAENLRTLQAELSAQADELSESQQVTERSLERFAALFSNLPVAALLVGQSGEILDVNRSAQQLFQMKPGGLSERFFHRLVGAVDYQRTVQPAFHQAQASGQSSTEAVEFVADGGVAFRGDLQISALPAVRDEPLQFACVVVSRSAELKHLNELQRTNELLLESEMAQRLSGMVASSTHNMALITDAQRRIVWANPAFIEGTGYGWSELVGRSPAMLQGEATDPEQVAFMRDRLAQGEGFSGVEILNYHKSGRPYWLLLDVQPVKGNEGQVTHYVAIETDITATKTAAQALVRSQAFLADTQHLAHIGGWELTVAGGELRWTLETGAIHGVPAEFVPTLENTIGFYQQPSRDAFVEAVQSAIALGESFELELDIVNAAGAALRVMVLGRPETVEGRCVRVAGVMQDITARHEAQRRIVELSERLGAATSAGGIGVWEWDLTSDSVYFDTRTRSLLGLYGMPFGGMRDALSEALGEGAGAGAGMTELERFDSAVQRACDTGEPLTVDIEVATSPEHRQLRLSGRVQRAADGTPQRLIGCAWDCTIEKLSEQMRVDKEAAERASKAKSEFLSRMSHELRTPLNAIMGFTQLMRMEAEAGLPPPPSNPKRLQYIEDAAKHLLALINEVLDVSRIEAGVMELRLERVNLEALLTECLPLIDSQAQARGIEILSLSAARAVENPHMATADPLRLKEVLINLLSNAVKYNKPHGQIRMNIRQIGDTIELSVLDTGMGMNDEQRKNLFQPFNRAGAETTRIEGTGMGLFVSKRYAELMGGSLNVTSQVGEGSTFTVRLLAAR